MKQKVISYAPGKLILLGEYAVLENAPALVAAVNRFARVTVRPLEAENFLVSAPILGIHSLPFRIAGGRVKYSRGVSQAILAKLDFFTAALEIAAQTLEASGHELFPAEILLDTEDFFLKDSGMKLGLGSSAALTVALIKALMESAGNPINTEEGRWQLFKMAIDAHRAAQGEVGSGIDVAASVFGDVLRYQISGEFPAAQPSIEKIDFPNDLHLLMVWSGKSASTRELVGRVHAFRDKNPLDFKNIMQEMSKASVEGCQALKENKTSRFLEIIGQYYRLMDKLGAFSGAPIISREHRRIAEIVQNCGAAYKPSGAGGGDLGIAFAPAKEIINNCAFQIKKAGFGIVDLNIVSNGLKYGEP